MTLQAIKWENGELQILDQLLLPAISKYLKVRDVQDGWKVINKMQVRGAPAIAIVGCLSLAVDVRDREYTSKNTMLQDFKEKLNYLLTARVTAVNMKKAADDLIALATELCGNKNITLANMKEKFLNAINLIFEKDIMDNKAIGDYGAKEILSHVTGEKSVTILTHCNTGSLATTGYGTALGVVRSLHSKNRLERVYCTETRPYNQGARLTAYELVHDKIPGTLICDSMVAALMESRNISAVVVGADRVAANGDTVNKIGTYQISIIARHHNVPFYVAAPRTSIDFTIPSGDQIVIEARPEREMTHVNDQRIAAPGIHCWNPGFDVTPASLITGIITEDGVFKPQDLSKLNS